MEQDREAQVEFPSPAAPRRSRFLVAWIALSIAGLIVGLVLGVYPLLYFGECMGANCPPAAAASFLSSLPFALAGLLACGMQALALRGRIPRAGRWALAGGVAWILAGPLLAAPWGSGLHNPTLNLALDGLALLVAGAMVGATQWLVVQDDASHAGRWILASAVGWGLGALVPVAGILLATGSVSPAVQVGGLLLAAGGAIAGPAITGLVIDRCLRAPPARAANRRRRTWLVAAGWLLLLAVALPALFRDQLMQRRAGPKLPDCLSREDCPRVVLPGADLERAKLKGASLVNADLSGANLQWAVLVEADLTGANLSGANLTRAELTGANLATADLRGAVLAGAGLGGAKMSGARLERADLTNADLIMAVMTWVKAESAVLAEAALPSADLTGADLTRANLRDANLFRANLTQADLTQADLGEANLSRANLSRANLTGANLAGADLSGADLTGAKVTADQLAQASSLKGATMPDGTVHE